ncbi:magnesium/cobalt transporter CorA [Flavihumibacter sp. R14]|nr:magnesium/cobalt transporter CorA [Flavihumibacter soli]
MGKIKRIRVKPSSRPKTTGSSPGSDLVPSSVLEPRITIRSYGDDIYHEREVKKYQDIDDQIAKFNTLTHWICVQGLGDLKFFEYLGNKFKIHQLIQEDIVSGGQRPKLDESSDYLFAVSRRIYINEELEMANEQLSFILLPNIVFSFQETYGKCFDPIINRLKTDKGTIRSGGSSYMLYALMDVVVDEYFELINRFGDELETIEELLYRRPKKSMMYDIQSVKRAMISIRRAVWPERDKINDLIRSESPLITRDTRTFLRDTYDHSMQIIDLVESYRDITTGLIDMNLSFISNGMNEIMKVLTIISSIFIPLTFIAGVYGMNFAYQDPATGKILNKNMPELYMANGYEYTLVAMLLIAILQIIYFWRKGWLSSK